MSKKLIKSISLLIAFVFLFAPLQSAFAGLINDGSPYKLIVHNQVVVDPGDPGATPPVPPTYATVVGAVYEVFRTHKINDAGEAKELNPPVSLGTFTIEEGVENGFSTATKGIYQVVPTKRAPGFLLPTESFTVEFPRMKNGVVDPNQTLEVYPKVSRLLGSVELLKWTNADPGETPLPGAVFKLWQDTELPTNAGKTYPYDMGDFTTGTDGKITVDNLPEGSYRFCEITPPDGYGPIPAPPADCVSFAITATDDATVNPAPIELTFQNYPIPSIIKTVDEAADGAGANHNIGEPYYYKLRFPIPENVGTFTYYRVIDSFPYEVDYLTDPGYSVAPTGLVASDSYIPYDPADPANSHKLTINFDIDALVAAYAAGERTITVTVHVKLNEHAEGGVPVTNTATLEWDHGSDSDDEPVTPTEGGFNITKRDSDGNPLAGVGFQLFTDTAATIPFISPVTGLEVIEESGADGIVRFTRLPYGTYYVKEVYVPEGFRISEVITEVVIPVADTFELIITNYRIGEDLPMTGTTGALIFLGAGVVLIGAGIFFARRKKNDKI
ncbi:MAG: SpaA isopeptide-forming pilin-related protein [Anaerolineaceae bacterium]|jgi:fimbrial isopeptide formation D2 family protein/LPXTG-motif cell wall-anchored protein